MPTLDETLRRVLALPREAGTPAAAEARALITAHLESLGYQVVAERFAFSPAGLNALPLFGAALGWLALVLVPLLIVPGIAVWLPLVTWGFGLAGAAALAVGAGLGWVAVGRDRALREDANLIVTRSGVAPASVRRWVVAHLDTKAQRHSMAGRLVAVWWIVGAIAAVTAVVGWRLRGPVPLPAALGVAVAALAAGVLAGRGRLHGTSPGARDNGTGMAALLTAAEVVAATTRTGTGTATETRGPTNEAMTAAIGFLVTGAEEFGLVGARIFAQHHPEWLREREVVNIDTVDQEGTLTIVVHDDRGRSLGERLVPGLADMGMPLRLRRLPLGIFVDSVPLARAGASAVTIGRLTWQTLRRIHTPSDAPDGLAFAAAIAVGRRLLRPGPGRREDRRTRPEDCDGWASPPGPTPNN